MRWGGVVTFFVLGCWSCGRSGGVTAPVAAIEVTSVPAIDAGASASTQKPEAPRPQRRAREAGNSERLCACYQRLTGEKSCEQMLGGADSDCERTYGDDCEMLVYCSRGEPGAFPTCLPGFIPVGARFRCRLPCTRPADCPEGYSCTEVDDTRSACMYDH
jgi:hypothetical protein